MYERDYSILRLPMGFGKTVCALTAANELIREGELRRVLVLAPLRVCELTWFHESAKWEHLNANVALGTGGIDSACTAVYSNAQIVVVNYDVIASLVAKSRDWIEQEFDGLILDELTKIKEPGGAWHKAVRKIADAFKWRVGLTGTVAEEGLTHLYGMCRVIDGGKALGRRKDRFLMEYFVPMDYHQRKWEPKPDTSERLAALIKPFTLDMDTDDQDRPPLDIQEVPIPLMKTTRMLYGDMAGAMVAELDGETVTAANAAVLSGKLQQIANGFIYDGDYVTHVPCGKVPELCDAVRHAKRALVIYQYEANLNRLREEYPDAPVIGKGSTRESVQAAVDGWNRGDVDVVLMHPQSGGHGLNMQTGGSTIIFFNPIWSRDQFDQCIARLWRRGQNASEVTVKVLVSEGTVEDEVVMPRLFDKRATADLFSDHLQAVTLPPAHTPALQHT